MKKNIVFRENIRSRQFCLYLEILTKTIGSVIPPNLAQKEGKKEEINDDR